MDANKMYDRAVEAVKRGNYDYAVEMFTQILGFQPDFVKARRDMRSAQRRKVQENGGMTTGMKFSSFFKGFVPLVKVGVFTLSKKKHDDRIIECEKFLQHNPNFTLVLEALASSAAQAEYVDTAIMIYEDIRESHPNNSSAIRHLARLYKDKGEIDKAADCYQRILASKPTDIEAGKAIKDLAALKTMKEGKWDQPVVAGGYVDKMKDQKTAAKLEQEQHIIRTDEDVLSRIARVKGDLEKDPRNTKILLQLGDLYARVKNVEQARNLFRQVKEIDPRSLVADRKLAELEIGEKGKLIQELKGKLEKTPENADLKAQIETTSKELQKFQIQHLKAQTLAAPTDLGLKFKLGKALFDMGDIDGAAQQFQQSVNEPRNRRESHRMFGICLMEKGMHDMAIDRFEKALAETTGMTNEAKEIIYELGICCEFTHPPQLDKAEEYFKRIYQVDIGFRDVSKRIEELYKMKKGGGGTS